MNWNSIEMTLGSWGELVTWAGNEAKLSGVTLDVYGQWDDGIVGEPVTGRIGLFAFEVISYDKLNDMFHIKRI